MKPGDTLLTALCGEGKTLYAHEGFRISCSYFNLRRVWITWKECDDFVIRVTAGGVKATALAHKH